MASDDLGWHLIACDGLGDRLDDVAGDHRIQLLLLDLPLIASNCL